MEVTRSVSVHHPTVQYGNCELFCCIKITTEDAWPGGCPPSITLEQQAEHLSQWADHLVQKEYNELHKKLIANKPLLAAMYELIPKEQRQSLFK